MKDLGLLTDIEYRSIYTAMAYFSDFDTLGPPDDDHPAILIVKELLERWGAPDG